MPQVIVDGVRADEQLGGYLGIGRASGDKAGNLRFTLGEPVVGSDGLFARLSSGGGQLKSGPLGEGDHADGLEQLVRRLKLLARFEAPAPPAEPFTVEKMSPGELQ